MISQASIAELQRLAALAPTYLALSGEHPFVRSVTRSQALPALAEVEAQRRG